jgi:predicted TPR repeat methyltransferase
MNRDNQQAALHDAYSADYDNQVRQYGSYMAEALFGLCYEYIHLGQTLLDIGIGTGLSVALFAKAGLQVHGMDFSPAMLALCQAKGIALDLKLHDVQQVPWPYADQVFDHLTCCGVLHFLPDLEAIFGEARRLLRPGGLFTFTTKVPPPSNTGARPYECVRVGEFEVFSHYKGYMDAVLTQYGLQPQKALVCLVGEEAFCAWVAR